MHFFISNETKFCLLCSQKLDELQAQMTSDHQKEIAQLQGDFAAERDRLLQQLQLQHKEEIEALRKELKDKDHIIKKLQVGAIIRGWDCVILLQTFLM